MRYRAIPLLLHVLCVFLQTAAFAAPFDPQSIPESLKPWIPWVMQGQEAKLCPYLEGDSNMRYCFAQGKLAIVAHDDGAQFTQTVTTSVTTQVELPGHEELWPQDLTANGRAATVRAIAGKPFVTLEPGQHVIKGRFLWNKLPESIALARHTPLVDLTLRGHPVPLPIIDESSRLWLEHRVRDEAKSEDSLELEVYRKIEDEIPLTMTTHLALTVSGKNREIELGPALPPHFELLAMNSKIPVKYNKNGMLLVKVSPGRHTIELSARHLGPIDIIGRPIASAPWPESELWVFEARNPLRLVSIEDLASIDPKQTTLPEAWRSLPAYRMAASNMMKLVTRTRGDADPAPDELELAREVWLDFDGNGYTFKDRITGRLQRSWRLEVKEPLQLGRAIANSQDLLITTQTDLSARGIELREQNLDLEAALRLDSPSRDLPTAAWNLDFQKVAATLHLPPGWRILTATGVDTATGTWLRSWDQINFFLLLVITIGLGKMFGLKLAALSFLTLLLVIPESNELGYAFLAILPALALLKVLPESKIQKLVSFYRLAALLVIIIIALPFMRQEIQQALHPTLEKEWQSLLAEPDTLTQREANDAESEEGDAESEEQAEDAVMLGDAAVATLPSPALEAPEAKNAPNRRYGAGPVSLKSYMKMESQPLTERDPKAIVQTGPGLPLWRWRTSQLSWNGPVRSDQTLNLWLISPTWNLVLAVSRVLLLALLLACIASPDKSSALFLRYLVRKKAAAIGIGLCLLLSPFIEKTSAAADYPTPALLEDLRARLTKPAACQPNCAVLSRLHLEASEQSLAMRLEAHADADVFIPLPGQASQWLPSEVLLDGVLAQALHRDPKGKLWILLGKGRHEIISRGPMPRRDSTQIHLLLKPKLVTSSLNGLSIQGVHDNGVVDDTLVLLRESKEASEVSESENTVIPPFLRLERTLQLRLDWSMTTRLSRLSQPGTAAVLKIPLLPGENITTAGIRTEDRHALINLGPYDDSIEWNSHLGKENSLILKAVETNSWTEWWRLYIGSTWHLSHEGIPPIEQVDLQNQRQLLFRPWPGEQVALTISRPEGAPGQSITFDKMNLLFKPGLRSTDSSLNLKVRSSRSTEHTLTLPENVELKKVMIDNQAEPLKQAANKLTLPIAPGEQQISIEWREPRGMQLRFLTSAIDLGSPGVNASLKIEVPQDRWAIFVGGHGAGPAVLFWGQLLIIILASIGLGKLGTTPLKAYQWFLLLIGLSQSSLSTIIIVTGFFLALSWRRQTPLIPKHPMLFNLRQIMLGLWAFVAAISIIGVLEQGFFGRPDMQIQGNSSSAWELNWFLDRTAGILPQGWMISLPMLYYQLAMLAWALWLAFAVTRWSRWFYESYVAGGMWHKVRQTKEPKAAQSEAAAVAVDTPPKP